MQLVPELDAGGAERTTLDIAAALAEAGARALVASDGGRLVSELQAKGGVFIPFPARTKNPLAMAVNVGRLARLVREEKIDLVHARSRAPAWVALAACRRTRTPFVTTYHGSYAGTSAIKLRYNSVMARGDAVIANSNYTAGLIASAYPFAKERVRIIHRGIDLKLFAPDAVAPKRVAGLRQAWGVAAGDRIILLAARLTGWKGQRTFIAAAEILKAQGMRGVTFVMAGDDQGRKAYLQELDVMVEKAGLAGMVRRVGHCADMPAAYLAAAVVTVPSTEPEAFGRVAVEAQAMGTPVIVSDLGAVPETVLAPPESSEQDRTGWRVPAGDAAGLAAAIAAALALGASATDALALRARRHVEQHFSLAQMCLATLDTYAELLVPRR